MVGDSLSDVEFGRRAGMYTVFIANASETRKEEAEEAGRRADISCTSLQEAVDLIPRRGEAI
jgi:phosphoglycolate phosphatase-like HAD superfamily hydrolase